ncbi:DUF4956 domain-containing protein [Acidimicrobiia bacterium]|nr:DUF4956 domain-containing protein [Acidimicrobiia bacterium]
MIYSLFGFDLTFSSEMLMTLLLVVAVSLFLWFAFYLFSEMSFMSSTYMFYMFIFLPIVIHVITSSISTNIALSLGMVGALSIVRFRTPIKNPVELLIYFLLIASGIVSYTNINLYVNFIGFCIVAIILIALFKNFSKKSSFISFKDENEEFSFLKLQTNKAVTLDNYSSSLFQTSFDGNSYIYRYRSNNSETLESIITLLEEKDIVSYSIDKSI